MNKIETRCITSLVKVFSDEELHAQACNRGSALQGETYSFQIAYRGSLLTRRMKVSVDTEEFDMPVEVRKVGLVPSDLPCYHDPDDLILRKTPGLYPDPLYPVTPEDEILLYPNQWHSLWVTVKVPRDGKCGICEIKVKLKGVDVTSWHKEKEWEGEETFSLQIFPCKQIKQNILHTEWFYTDCISTWYQAEPFSKRYWKLVDKYMENAAAHSINMLLTPVFTPAIETRVNDERPTIQLVDIVKNGENYSFGFEKLEKWIELCQKNGIEYLEIAHLFSQWGARYAPKIIANVDGCERQIFGWNTASDSEEYLGFLKQFLPELTEFLKGSAIKDRVYFHISDEPAMERLEAYKKLCDYVRKLIGDYEILDAISEVEFFKQTDLSAPVASTDSIDAFLEQGVENLWAYYCCIQYKDCLSNRFFYMPSVRNRIIGIQLYKFNIKGFLHWGYNHWYIGWQSSKKNIRLNPFLVTDADVCYPSGDAFLVYPGENGPVDSIRSEVLEEAFQDYRALCLLETFMGRKAVLEFLEEGIEPITFNEYPAEDAWLLDKREKINQMLGLYYTK